MFASRSRLVTLVMLIEQLPLPSAPAKRKRGRPRHYAERLFLQALVIMIVRRLSSVHGLLGVLAEDTAEMQCLRDMETIPAKMGHLESFSLQSWQLEGVL